MIAYKTLIRKPILFKNFTGLSVKAFQSLLSEFEEAYEIELDKRDQARHKARQRSRGAGQKGALPQMEDKLVFIL